MTVVKPVMITLALLLFSDCSANRNDAGNADAPGSPDYIRLDTAGLQGEWQLLSYFIDNYITSFDASQRYVLSFNELDNTFGLTTDCNLIGGTFVITNDTIRFKNISATEIACENMTVEENMLRLLNEGMTYAVLSCDTLLFHTSDYGKAVFIKSDTESLFE